jgi:hypothetical protein
MSSEKFQRWEYGDDPPPAIDLEQKIKKLKVELEEERARGRNRQMFATLFFLAALFEGLFILNLAHDSSEPTGIVPIDTMIVFQNEASRTLRIEIDHVKRRRHQWLGCMGAVDEALEQLWVQVEARFKVFENSEAKRLLTENRTMHDKHAAPESITQIARCYR